MASSLGTLTYDLVAKIGGFTAGLDQAAREAQKKSKEIEASMKSIGVAGYAVGTALGSFLKDGIIAAANAFPALLESVAKFQDLSDETGASAEGLAGFAVAAATAGVSMESVAGATIKLTKNLVEVDDESKAAGAAIAALGLNIEDFKKLDPVAQYEAVSKALGGFADGANKTAVAVLLFGKAGAEQLKVMKALEEQGGRSNILTAQQIALADEYLDRQAKLRAELGLYAGQIATQFIEPTNVVIGLLKEAAKEFFNTSQSVTALGVNAGVQTFAEGAGRALAGLIDYVKTTASEIRALGDFIGSTVTATGQLLSADLAGARKTGEDFRARMGIDKNGFKLAGAEAAKSFVSRFDETIARSKADTNRRLLNASNYGTPGDLRPQLKPPVIAKAGRGGGGAKDDPTKKLLENELAAFKAMGDQAKEQLADRNRILDLYNQQGLLSVKDYYAGLKAAQDDATAAQAKSLDDQVASLEKYKAAAAKETDVADAQGKINKLTEERAKLYRQAGIEAIAMGIKEQEAAKAVKAAFDEVNAKVLEFQGNMRAAAEIRFDASNEKLITQATAEHNDAVLKQIALLKEYSLAQADINKLQKESGLTLGSLSITEDRIALNRQLGIVSEFKSLTQLGEARQKALGQLREQLAAYDSIPIGERTAEQVQAVERLRLEVDKLAASVDPLAQKFDTIFQDSLGNAFGDFITGTKTAKEAFTDFANSVVSQIGKLVAQNLAQELFGALGQGNSPGSLLSTLFGGGKAAGGGVGASAAAAGTSALATSATTASGAIAALSAAASAAALSLGGSGAAGLFGAGASAFAGANAVGAAGGDALGALIKLAGYEGGGFTGMGAANDPAGIVHKGEVVFSQDDVRNAGGVASVEAMRRNGRTGFSQVNNFTVQGRIDRSTETQLAQEVRRRTLTAAGRF